MNDKLTALWDALWWLVPFSFVGAIFGDAIRKDVLTKRQRVAVGMFCSVFGPVLGWIAMREWGLPDYYGVAIAGFAPTITYDVVGLVAALIHWLKSNPDKIKDFAMGFVPWRKP